MGIDIYAVITSRIHEDKTLFILRIPSGHGLSFQVQMVNFQSYYTLVLQFKKISTLNPFGKVSTSRKQMFLKWPDLWS